MLVSRFLCNDSVGVYLIWVSCVRKNVNSAYCPFVCGICSCSEALFFLREGRSVTNRTVLRSGCKSVSHGF